MNNKTIKSITSVILASAIGTLGCQSKTWDVTHLRDGTSIAVGRCSSNVYDTYADRNGDGKYETQYNSGRQPDGSVVQTREFIFYKTAPTIEELQLRHPCQ